MDIIGLKSGGTSRVDTAAIYLYVTKTNSAGQDQVPQKEAFDQGFHCLLLEYSIKI